MDIYTTTMLVGIIACLLVVMVWLSGEILTMLSKTPLMAFIVWTVRPELLHSYQHG